MGCELPVVYWDVANPVKNKTPLRISRGAKTLENTPIISSETPVMFPRFHETVSEKE